MSDERNEHGCIRMSGCSILEGDDVDGISITVAAEYRDMESPPRAFVILGAHGGTSGREYVMDRHNAVALAHILLSAAGDVERNRP